jgi:hypothetical protein
VARADDAPTASGHARAETIMGGLNGTPMPSYATSVTRPEDAWALIAWISSLSPSVRPSLNLANFARERERIGSSGHVEPAHVVQGALR